MSFANFIRENSGGIHQVEDQLEMAKDWNCFWEFFNLGRPPPRIRPSEKSLCFSTSLKCAFEPSIIIFSAPLSPRFPSSAPMSPHIFSSTPVSPRFLSSAPSNPHFPFSFYLGRSPITMRPFLFYLGRSPITMRPVSLYLSKKKNLCLILHQAGRLEQLDHSWYPFHVSFFIGQVAWNN